MIVYHFKEIFYRILYILFSLLLSIIVVWAVKENWLNTLCDIPLVYIQLSEAFFSYLHLAIYTSLIINLPYISYHILSFLSPGLYEYEFHNYRYLTILFNILFILISFVYFLFLLPTIVQFFIEFDSLVLQPTVTLSDYVQFIILIVNLAFFTLIIPLLTFTVRVNGYRKFIYMALLLISAFITPPDVFSLLLTTIPTLILFEFATFINTLLKKHRNTQLTSMDLS